MVPNLVIHAVEQPRHHWEDSGTQLLHVLGKEADVTLEESHPPSMTEHYRLEVGGVHSVFKETVTPTEHFYFGKQSFVYPWFIPNHWLFRGNFVTSQLN